MPRRSRAKCSCGCCSSTAMSSDCARGQSALLHRLGAGLQVRRDLRAVLIELVDRVVVGARLRIGEHLVRLADALELLGMRLRRELTHQREVGLLDRALVGGAIDAEDLVETLRRVPHVHPIAFAIASATESTNTISIFDATSDGSSRASLDVATRHQDGAKAGQVRGDDLLVDAADRLHFAVDGDLARRCQPGAQRPLLIGADAGEHQRQPRRRPVLADLGVGEVQVQIVAGDQLADVQIARLALEAGERDHARLARGRPDVAAEDELAVPDDGDRLERRDARRPTGSSRARRSCRWPAPSPRRCARRRRASAACRRRATWDRDRRRRVHGDGALALAERGQHVAEILGGVGVVGAVAQRQLVEADRLAQLAAMLQQIAEPVVGEPEVVGALRRPRRNAFSARSASPSTSSTSPRKSSYAAVAFSRRRRGHERALDRADVAAAQRVRGGLERAVAGGALHARPSRAPPAPARESSRDRARRPRAPTPRRRRARGRARAARRRWPDPRAPASARARAPCAPAATAASCDTDRPPCDDAWDRAATSAPPLPRAPAHRRRAPAPGTARSSSSRVETSSGARRASSSSVRKRVRSAPGALVALGEQAPRVGVGAVELDGLLELLGRGHEIPVGKERLGEPVARGGVIGTQHDLALELVEKRMRH